MVTAGWNPSTLKSLYNSATGKACTGCCGDPAGANCNECDNTTPLYVYVKLTGVRDSLNGGCLLEFPGDPGPFVFSASANNFPASLVDNVVIRCTQSGSFPCSWFGFLDITGAGATVDRYVHAKGPADCSSFFNTINLSTITVEVTKLPAGKVNVFYRIELANSFGSQLDCLAANCVCCSKELDGGGGDGQIWAFENGQVSVQSQFCSPLHVNELTTSLSTSGCAGSEEKITGVVTIHDENHDPLEGAFVTVNISGVGTQTMTETTDVNGEATFVGNCICESGTITMTIVDVTKEGFKWLENNDEDDLFSNETMSCI